MAIKKMKGLGRGLEALLNSSMELGEDTATVSNTPISIAIADLQVGQYQPRSHIDDSRLNELAASIKAQGLLQPILIRPLAASDFHQRYEIIAGERRFRAAKMAGLTAVPVLIKNVDDQTAAAIALIENIQREDLNPLEEAQGIHRLMTDFCFTHEQAATAIGRSRSAVSNLLRLLKLSEPVQTMLLNGDIDMGHARALLAIDKAMQITLAQQIVAKQLSVRAAEQLVAQMTATKPAHNSPHSKNIEPKSHDMTRLEQELSDLLATEVVIKIKAKHKVELIINCADLAGLDMMMTRLRAYQGTEIGH